MAILDRFSKFFETSDHQYGFKKHLSCRDAIYTLRQVTERYISNGSTDNNFFMCRPALDLSKAFDRTDNYVLLIKLMYRNLQKFGTRYLFLLFFSFCIKARALRYDTIRDAILTFARKPTWVSLIYRTESTTEKCKTEKNWKVSENYPYMSFKYY